MGANRAARQASASAAEARRDEEERQARIRAGTDSINSTFDSQFGPGFFDGLQRSYVDFARPQLDEQKNKAREQLVYALARDGTLDSSIRTERDADLTKDYNRNLTTITDKGREYATNARSSVEDARAQLISNLTATGDNIGAANAATARARAIGTPPAFEPIGQLFSDWTAGFSQRAAQERAAALAAGQTPTTGLGLFGPSRNAVKVS